MEQIKADGTDKRFTHSVSTQAARADIWALWTNVKSWKDWDKGLKDAVMETDFALGARGTIIPYSGPRLKFEVTEYVDKESYTIMTNMPLSKLHVRRTFEDGPQTILRHDVWFDGPLSVVCAGFLGPEFRVLLLSTMATLVDIAEDKPST